MKQLTIAALIAVTMLSQVTYAESFTATAYCGCSCCCGKWAKYHKTASGTTPVQGRTIAVDKKVIPLGTKVLVNGTEYTAEDTGVRGKWIDIYFDSHSEALKFGKQTVEVEIVKEDGNDTGRTETIQGSAETPQGEQGNGSDAVLVIIPANSNSGSRPILTEEMPHVSEMED